MSGLDGFSPATKSFAEQQQAADSPLARIKELAAQSGFHDAPDVETPPFIPGKTPPPEFEAPAAPTAPQAAPEEAPSSPETPPPAPETPPPGGETAINPMAAGMGLSADPGVNPVRNIAEGAGAVAKGAGKVIDANLKHPEQFDHGFYHVAQNVGNAVLEATEAVNGWLKRANLSTADFSAEKHKFTFADADFAKPETDAEKLAYGTGEFVTQFAAFMGGGHIFQGGKMVAAAGRMATGFATNFAAFDPHQKKLGDFLNDHTPLHNAFVDYLSSHPGESEAEGRFKNAVGNLILDAGMAAALVGVGKTYKAFIPGSKVEAALNSTSKMSPAEAQAAAEAGTLTKGTELPAGGGGSADLPAPAPSPANQAKTRAAEIELQNQPQVPPGESINGDIPPQAPQNLPPEPGTPPSRADAALDGKPPPAIGEPPPPTGAEAQGGRYSLSAIDEEGDIRATVRRYIDENPALFEANRGGTVPESETLAQGAKIAANEASRMLNFPVGQAMNHAEITAARFLAEEATKEYHRLAKAVLTSADPVAALAEAKIAASTAAKMFLQFAGGLSESGRALHAAQISGGQAKFAAEKLALAQKLAKATTTPEQAVRQAMMIDQILSEPNIDKVRWLAKFTNKSMGQKVGDAVLEAWITARLSRPTTTMKIIVGGATTTTMHILEKMGAMAVSRLKGDDTIAARYFTPGAAPDFIGSQEVQHAVIGLFEGIQDMGRMLHLTYEGHYVPGVMAGSSWLALSGERAISGKLWSEDNPIAKGIAFLSHTAGAQVNKGIKNALDYAGQVAEKVTAPIIVADDAVRLVNYRIELQALAAREAANLNLTGPDFAAHVQKVLNDPPDAIKLAAEASGREAAFATPLTGWNKKTEDFLRGFPGRGAVVAPFMKANLNMVAYALERNPVTALLGSQVRAELAAGGTRQTVQLGKLAAGTAVMGTAAWMALDGKITGPGPVDPRANARLRETGWQPYSLAMHHEDGTTSYHSYTAIDGVNTLFKMATDMVQIFPYCKEDGPKDNLLAVAAALAFRSVTPDIVSRNLYDVLNALHDPDGPGKKFVAQLAASTIPGIIPLANRSMGDGMQRSVRPEPNSNHPIWDLVKNQMKAQIPGLSADLPPRRNLFGEAIYYPDGHGPGNMSPVAFVDPFKTSTAKNDTVTNEIIRLGMVTAYVKDEAPEGQNFLRLDIVPSTIRKSVKIGPQRGQSVSIPVQLSNSQWDKYQQLAAGIGLRSGQFDDEGEEIPLPERGKTVPTLREAMSDMIDKFSERKTSDSDRRAELKILRSRYTKAAKAQLFKEEPDLVQKIRDARAAGIRARQVQGPGADVTGTLQGVSQ